MFIIFTSTISSFYYLYFIYCMLFVIIFYYCSSLTHWVMALQIVLIPINSAPCCKQQPRLFKLRAYRSTVSFLTSNTRLESLHSQPDSPSGTQSSCLWDHNAGREQMIKISALCLFLPFSILITFSMNLPCYTPFFYQFSIKNSLRLTP